MRRKPPAHASRAKLSKLDGRDMDAKVSTLCLHGDRANSAEVARVVKETLLANGIAVAALR